MDNLSFFVWLFVLIAEDVFLQDFGLQTTRNIFHLQIQNVHIQKHHHFIGVRSSVEPKIRTCMQTIYKYQTNLNN